MLRLRKPHRAAARLFRFAALLAPIPALLGCGGGGGSTPTAPPTPTVQNLTVTGTSRATGPNSCASDSHTFLAADGAISVTLQQTTGGVGLSTQVCAGNDDNNCSINTTRMAVGDTVQGTRKGGESQTMKFLTLNCGAGQPPPATPIEYRATITFLH